MHFKHTLLQIDNKTINHIEFLNLYWYHFDYCQMFLDFICSNLSGFNKNLNIQFLLSFSYKLILKLCLLSLHFVLVDQEFSVSSAAVSTVASQQEGPGFKSSLICVLSLCLRGFSSGTVASSHRPMTCKSYLIALQQAIASYRL